MTLISIREAAEILGVGRTTAYRLAKAGRLPCVRSFGPLRVHAEKLVQLIEAEADANLQARQLPLVSKGEARPSPTSSGSPSQMETEKLLRKLLTKRPARL
jgi:excisionase family DNA binding protein